MAIQEHELNNLSPPDAVISAPGSDHSSSIGEANLRQRRPGRVDGLGYLATPEPKNETHLLALRDVVWHIFWIHVLGRRILIGGDPKSKYAGRFPKKIDHFEKCLTAAEVDIVRTNDITESEPGPEIRSLITEHVETMSLDAAVAVIQDHRPNGFYLEILHLQATMFHGCRRTLEQSDRSNSPGSEHLEIINLEWADNYKRLYDLLESLVEFRTSVQQAVESTVLASEYLKALRNKFAPFEKFWSAASIAVSDAGGPEFGAYGASLIKLESERWWDVDTKQDNNIRWTSSSSASMRSGLNFIVPTVSLLCTVPAALAWIHGAAEPGITTDSDFFQTIVGSTMQLLGLVTFIWPTLSHPRLSGQTWFLIWTLAAFSAICAVVSVPLYLYAPNKWSFAIGFAGGIAQAIVQLQVVNAV